MKKTIIIIASFFIVNMIAVATVTESAIKIKPTVVTTNSAIVIEQLAVTTKSAITGELVKIKEEYIKGQELFEQKKYKEADVVLKKAKDIYPEDNEVTKLYAKNLSALGKYKESYKILEKLTVMNNVYTKNDKEVYDLQIQNILNLIKNKTIVENLNLKEALTIHQDIYADIVWNENPLDSATIFEKGNELFKAKNYEDALKTFEQDRSGDLRNLFSAATLSRFLKKYDESIKYYEKVIVVDPDFYEAYLGMAESYLKLNNTEKRVENLRKYLDYKPDERVYFALANTYYSSVYRDYQKTREILVEALGYFPDSKAIGDLLKDVNKKLGILEN